MSPRAGGDPRIVRTRALEGRAGEVRALLDRAFGPRFTDDDWGHALGGLHVLVEVDGDLVAHGSVVPRRLWIGERPVRCGYVEAVAVQPDLQGRGHGTLVMRALEEELRSYDLGALSTGAHGFYARLGWARWRGPTWVRGEGEPRRTVDEDGGVMVWRTPSSPPFDRTEALACEARPGDDW